MSRRPQIPERWRKAASHGVSLLETVRGGASYNPLSPTVIQNPYKTYARLRRYSPVHRSRILGSWVLTRYEDVLTAARDHERFSNDPRWRRATASVLPPAPDDYSILLVDPPEHTRLRKVVAEVFSRTRLRALNEIIEKTAFQLIERAGRRRTIDWIGDVAAPASMRVMLSMMAIPESDHGHWEIWTRDRARLLEMIATRQQRKTAHLAGAEIQRYFKGLLRDRMQSDGPDAISVLARHAAEGDRISPVEACDMLMVLMIAGNETTTNLIGNGMLALLRHPGQMQLLRDEPGRMRDAIDEMLRFDSPVQTDFRIARTEIALRGRKIRTGDGVILLTGSANRDERAFENADTFDIARKGPRHLSFGQGVHHCIGAELARMEASAVFTEALQKFGKIELADSRPRYRRSTVIRGLCALPLKVERRLAGPGARL
ncbi:MAG: cytochrome P450 [Rhodospirillaceae bacterium]|nr:cytochrome P450 [Rhodospirillaceae bacterium]